MEENDPLGSGDQPTPQLPDDLLRNVFLRLPPDPSAFAFVSAACKAWLRIVDDDANFLRSFREAHRNAPPLLGLFSDAVYGELHFTPTPTTFYGAMNLPAPPPLFHAYGCTHGRLLLHGAGGKPLLVWDPLTGEEHLVPSPPPRFLPGQSCGAALVCDANHAHNSDCHSSPFRVVFAYSEFVPLRSSHPPLVPRHTFACVYSSVTSSWGPAATIDVGCHFDGKLGAVAGNSAAVYWMTGEASRVLEFHLDTQRLVLTETPLEVRGCEFLITPAMDAARFGLAGVIGDYVLLFWREDGVAGWIHRTILPLDDFLPADHAYANQHLQIGEDGLLRSDDDEYEDELDAPMEPKVVGFSEQGDAVFLHTELGVFMIDLKSGQHQQVPTPTTYFTRVYPYSTFYTAGSKYIFDDIQKDRANNNIQSGGEISDPDEKY
ncbi:hypothetical protein ACQ4PT_002095 [Festuca glaucescens]